MQRRDYLAVLAGVGALAGCSNSDASSTPDGADPTGTEAPTETDTPTPTDIPLITQPAEDLLLSIDQMPTGWERTDENLEGDVKARLFQRNRGAGVYVYAEVFDSIEAAADDYEARIEEDSKSTAMDELDLEGADEAHLHQDDGVIVQFRVRNARGKVYQTGSVVAEQETVDFAELMLENY